MSKQLKEAKVENLPIHDELCSRTRILEEDRKDHFYCLKGLKGTGCTVSSFQSMYLFVE